MDDYKKMYYRKHDECEMLKEALEKVKAERDKLIKALQNAKNKTGIKYADLGHRCQFRNQLNSIDNICTEALLTTNKEGK